MAGALSSKGPSGALASCESLNSFLEASWIPCPMFAALLAKSVCWPGLAPEGPADTNAVCHSSKVGGSMTDCSGWRICWSPSNFIQLSSNGADEGVWVVATALLILICNMLMQQLYLQTNAPQVSDAWPTSTNTHPLSPNPSSVLLMTPNSTSKWCLSNRY